MPYGELMYCFEVNGDKWKTSTIDINTICDDDLKEYFNNEVADEIIRKKKSDENIIIILKFRSDYMNNCMIINLPDGTEYVLFFARLMNYSPTIESFKKTVKVNQ